ncbi:MAG: phytanoyl-CoA dioxygenase family protein [Rhodospirillaceae bacterium]
MGKFLSDEQVNDFKRKGYVYPLDGISADEAAACREDIEYYEKDTGSHAQFSLTLKAHMPFGRICRLISNERILDAVEDLIGPNIICWGSSVFAKDVGDGKWISWHADTYYYGLVPQESLTLWLAFTPANPYTGCIRCIPGSHLVRTEFENDPSPDNLLIRGQTTKDVDETQAEFMPLEPGQFSIHHECTVHSSEPNQSKDRRIGISIHYATPGTRQTKWHGEGKPVATLLRGVDDYGYWDYEDLTVVDYDPQIAAHMVKVREEFLGRR